MAITPFIADHPLIQHKLTLLRDKNTGSKEFRELIAEITMLLCYEATRDLPLKEVEIETPMAVTKTQVISGRKLAFVPILRAGLGMVDGVMQLVPAAKVGHIGLYRDSETALPVEYYCKLPNDIANREVIVLDPMLATGGSAIDAITQIKARGVKNIKFMCIIAAAGSAGRSPRCEDLLRFPGRPSGRAQVHHSRSGRCRRPYLRHQVIPVVNQKSGGNFLRFFLLWHGSHFRQCDAEASIAPQHRRWTVRVSGQRAIKQCPRRALGKSPSAFLLPVGQCGSASAPTAPSNGLCGFRNGEA